MSSYYAEASECVQVNRHKYAKMEADIKRMERAIGQAHGHIAHNRISDAADTLRAVMQPATCPCDSEHDCARSIGLVVAGECIVQAKPSAFESFEKELPENLQKLNPTRAALDEANAKMRQAVAEREAQDVKRKAERDAARAAGADR